jgi:hypothetical protein
MVLMFQREVAERIVATVGDDAYGRLGVLAGWRTDARIMFDVAPSAFVPPPKVTSSVVRLIPRIAPDPCDLKTLERVTEAAFGQRRKMLRQSLKSLGVDPLRLTAAAGIDPTRRAETVPISGFVAMARELADIQRRKTTLPFRKEKRRWLRCAASLSSSSTLRCAKQSLKHRSRKAAKCWCASSVAACVIPTCTSRTAMPISAAARSLDTTPARCRLTLGHEIAGVVDEVGSDADQEPDRQEDGGLPVDRLRQVCRDCSTATRTFARANRFLGVVDRRRLCHACPRARREVSARLRPLSVDTWQRR